MSGYVLITWWQGLAVGLSAIRKLWFGRIGRNWPRGVSL